MDNKEEIVKKNKPDMNEKTFIMDINIMESPIFMFKQQRSVKSMKQWLESGLVSERAKEKIKNNSEFGLNSPMEYMRWQDSSGNTREFCVMSMQVLPSGFEQDVFYALVSLLIRQQSPVKYNEETGIYDLKTNVVYCNVSDISDKLGLYRSGENYSRIYKGLERMKVAQYYGFDKGFLYDKKTGKYVENNVSGHFSLINSLEFQNIGDGRFDGLYNNCTIEVEINRLVLSNIRYSFIKFLNESQYFSLNSGLTRRIYSYLEGNKYSSNGLKTYLKVSYDVFKRKIPIEAQHNSRLKTRIKKPLTELVQDGVISDYFYGDEYKVNNVKEQCIYFIFKGTKATLIKQLEEEYVKKHPKLKSSKDKKQENLEQELELVFPEDIKQELENFGINSKKIMEIMSKYTKYKIAEYILWLKDGIAKGKAKDPAGMFVFAITDEMVKVNRTHPHIVEFVARYKSDVEGKISYKEIDIENAYKVYIELELREFKDEDEFMFDSLYNSTLDDIEEAQDGKIKSQRKLYSMAEKKSEKEKILKIIEKWEKFSIEKEKSELFMEQFIKKSSAYRSLKLYEDFRRDFIEKNS